MASRCQTKRATPRRPAHPGTRCLIRLKSPQIREPGRPWLVRIDRRMRHARGGCARSRTHSPGAAGLVQSRVTLWRRDVGIFAFRDLARGPRLTVWAVRQWPSQRHNQEDYRNLRPVNGLCRLRQLSTAVADRRDNPRDVLGRLVGKPCDRETCDNDRTATQSESVTLAPSGLNQAVLRIIFRKSRNILVE